MTKLKTALAAGVLAAATTLAAADAGAAERVGVYAGHGGFAIGVSAGHVHRGTAVFGGWYAAPGLYRPYAYYRAHPRLRACFAVTSRGYHNGRPALLAATMCYGRNGARFVVPASRHVVRFY